MTQSAVQGGLGRPWRTADAGQVRANGKTADPWWRSRDPGRHMDPEIAHGLYEARITRGWTFRAASKALGLSTGYLCDLERGRRVPSLTVAVILVVGYQLPDSVARSLYGVARPWVGRDCPMRTGYFPDEGERGLPWGGDGLYATWCR